MTDESFAYRLALHAMDLDTDGHDVGVAGAWKQPVRVASTANVTLASGVENGDTLDGVTLVGGDRILLKNQTTASENGIYEVAGTGAPIRTDDFNAGDLIMGSIVYVIEGTTNGGKAFRVTNTTEPVVGTNSINFAEFGTVGVSGGAEFPRPLTAQDPSDSKWYVVVAGDGTAVMVTG